MFGVLAELEASLGGVVGGLDPSGVAVFDAPGLWEAFDRLERLAVSGKMLLARRVEDACVWRRAGFRSAAEQLASSAGISVTAAKAMLATSRQLVELPATEHALREGRLSAAKVEVVVAAAVVVPDAEAGLLETAMGSSLAETREACLRARAVDRDAAYGRIRRDRSAREYMDGEGAWNFWARGTVDAGAEFRTVFEPLVDEQFQAARAEGRSEPRDAYAFDALDRARPPRRRHGKRRRPRAEADSGPASGVGAGRSRGVAAGVGGGGRAV